MRSRRPLAALAASLLLFGQSALARVISYAPVTNRQSAPAIQSRLGRHFLLVEYLPTSSGILFPTTSAAHAVLYDSEGRQAPRVLLPSGEQGARFSDAALWEDAAGTMFILLATDADTGDNPQRQMRWLFTNDGGASWKTLAIPRPGSTASIMPRAADAGGPVTGGPGQPIRLGTAADPFVVSIGDSTAGGSVWAVSASGAARKLLAASGCCVTLVGSNAANDRLLVHGMPAPTASGSSPRALYRMDLTGTLTKVFDMPTVSWLEGWIADGGAVYLRHSHSVVQAPFLSKSGFSVVEDGVLTQLAALGPAGGSRLFAVPTADFRGAWILERASGAPTILRHHEAGGALTEAWRDMTGPQVEALHASPSGERLLVQVHRPRPVPDQQIFIDPALAVWKVGDPAPRDYDELFLIEQESKGFVHLDVDAVAAGGGFVFSSGPPAPPVSGGPSGGGGGGGDVAQEWGVVRGALAQKLVIPSVARASGLLGSFWRTDLVLRNPSSEPLEVTMRLAPPQGPALERTISLDAGETRLEADVLLDTFGIESGSGTLFLKPEPGRSLEATSRTYTTSPKGTYGMSAGAMDVFAAAGPRFPSSFSAALLGPDFRTNLVAADVTGRGGEATVRFHADSSFPETPEAEMEIPAGGPAQMSGLASSLGVSPHVSGAVLFRPAASDAVASLIAIDNRTNDPTLFPPDLSSGVVRTIPAIVHADGASGSRFRSDLFLFNTFDTMQSVTLAIRPWSTNESETLLTLTLLPREAKTIRDALFTLVGKTGVARLRYTSTTGAIRATSRTYNVDAAGGTYGLLIPPLNAFQSGGPGDSLEILGPLGGPGFRTNLALVELSRTPGGTAPRVRIEILDQRGLVLDRFEMNVPMAGGVQLDDIFRARGLGDGPRAGVIRVSPFGGIVGAYATVIDNGTNDPIYFPANLAAR